MVSKTTAFYLPEDCRQWLNRQSAIQRRSMSWIVVELIRKAEREERDADPA